MAFARRVARFLDDVFHVARREKLPFLDVDGLAGSGDRADEVGLPAQECRRLQHVDRRGRSFDFLDLVNVGEHRHADLPAHLGEDLKTLLHAETAERLDRAAVRLVVGRFVDKRDAEAGRDLLQLARRVERELPRLDDARARYEEKRLIEPCFEAAELHAAGRCKWFASITRYSAAARSPPRAIRPRWIAPARPARRP